MTGLIRTLSPRAVTELTDAVLTYEEKDFDMSLITGKPKTEKPDADAFLASAVAEVEKHGPNWPAVALAYAGISIAASGVSIAASLRELVKKGR